MIVQAATYTSGAEMIAAYKARRAKEAAAARRVQTANQNKRHVRLVPVRQQMDDHVQAWKVWKSKPWDHSRNYIKWRCGNLGIAYRDLTGSCRLPEIVEARDLIAFEFKEYIRPDISCAELSRLMGRSHPAATFSVARVRASLGDPKAIETLAKERARIARYQAKRVAE